MRANNLSVVAIGTMVFFCLTGYQGSCAAPPERKNELRVLYAGHSGTPREKDFLGFLEEHFVKVGKRDLAKFTEEQAEAFDVVILDYDGDGFNSPRPKLSRDYSRATVTLGVTGALLCGWLGLKTGYL